MRRIVMFNRVSADGYFGAPDGNLDWVIPDPDVDKLGASGTGDYDTVVLGRKTYEIGRELGAVRHRTPVLCAR